MHSRDWILLPLTLFWLLGTGRAAEAEDAARADLAQAVKMYMSCHTKADFEGAITAYLRILERHPEAKEVRKTAMYTMADIYLHRLKDTKKAESIYVELLAGPAARPELASTCAEGYLVCVVTGLSPANAKVAFQEAVKRYPNYECAMAIAFGEWCLNTSMAVKFEAGEPYRQLAVEILSEFLLNNTQVSLPQAMIARRFMCLAPLLGAGHRWMELGRAGKPAPGTMIEAMILGGTTVSTSFPPDQEFDFGALLKTRDPAALKYALTERARIVEGAAMHLIAQAEKGVLDPYSLKVLDLIEQFADVGAIDRLAYAREQLRDEESKERIQKTIAFLQGLKENSRKSSPGPGPNRESSRQGSDTGG